MNFKCVKNNLENILKEAENFIGKDLDLPVLAGILLEVENGFLTISSTNIDSTFNSEIPVVMEEKGKVVVLGDIFCKTISGIKDDEIEINIKDNLLIVKSKNNEVEINILDYNDFPTILKLEDQEEKDLNIKINISKNDFLNGMNSVVYSASKSNIKPELSSVFINGNADDIIFVATDGFRLAEKRFKYQNDSNDEFSALVPSGFVLQVIKVLTISQTDILDVYFYQNQIFIKGKEFIISSRLVNGDYVDYKKLIPEDTNTSVILLKQDFIDASKLINIFSDDFNQINLNITKKSFEIETKNKMGKNNVKIPAVIMGDEVKQDFNHKFIQDAFVSLNTDSIEFIFNPTKPLLIKPVGDKSFRYIIMPLSR